MKPAITKICSKPDGCGVGDGTGVGNDVGDGVGVGSGVGVGVTAGVVSGSVRIENVPLLTRISAAGISPIGGPYVFNVSTVIVNGVESPPLPTTFSISFANVTSPVCPCISIADILRRPGTLMFFDNMDKSPALTSVIVHTDGLYATVMVPAPISVTPRTVIATVEVSLGAAR